MVGWFGLVICDEVHFLKNIDCLMYRAVELLAAREKLFLTGTPMINRPVDLVGILQLLWDDAWWGDTDPSLEDYRRAALSSGTSISPAEVGRYLQYLTLTLYQRFASARSGEQMSALTTQAVLPVILNTIQLRKMFADEIKTTGGHRVRIGSEIPPYIIHTVELAMEPIEQALYYRVHETQAKGLTRGVDEDTGDGRVEIPQAPPPSTCGPGPPPRTTREDLDDKESE